MMMMMTYFPSFGSFTAIGPESSEIWGLYATTTVARIFFGGGTPPI